MPGPFGGKGLEVLRLPDVSSLRDGLNHTVLQGVPEGLFAGRFLPVQLGSERFPATAAMVAEAEELDWSDVPATGFSYHHYRGHTKCEAGSRLQGLSREGLGSRVTWLWFVVAGSGSLNGMCSEEGHESLETRK